MKVPRRRWPEGTWMQLTSGKILRGLMDAKGLSNADVALHAKVGRTFISALVNERKRSCTPQVAVRIAERLEVPLEVLFVPKGSAVGGRSNKNREKAVA